MGVTCDGNSANRRFFNLHAEEKDVYKVKNPFTTEDRPLFFLSDPPHLIKTTRNCWASQKRTLWVSMVYLYCNLLAVHWFTPLLFGWISGMGRRSCGST